MMLELLTLELLGRKNYFDYKCSIHINYDPLLESSQILAKQLYPLLIYLIDAFTFLAIISRGSIPVSIKEVRLKELHSEFVVFR